MSGIISLNIDTNSLVFYVDASNKKSIVNGDTILKDLTENNFDSTPPLEEPPTKLESSISVAMVFGIDEFNWIFVACFCR